MAAERTEETDPDVDDAQWASEQEYKQEVQESQDVVVPKGDMKFRITQESPIRQAALVDEYNIRQMESLVEEMPEQTDLQQDPGQIDGDEADAVLRLIAYFRDLLEPNVMKPDVHWADPHGSGFDLSTLHDEDLIHLVDHVTGKDAGIIPDEGSPKQRKQHRAERFR